MTTPDLTTTTGIAAACKSTEGQKALLRGDGCKSAEDFVKLALTALPLALAEAERMRVAVRHVLMCSNQDGPDACEGCKAAQTAADAAGGDA